MEERSVPATFTWVGANSGDWSLGTNWDQGSAPDTGADVVINNGTTPIYNTTVAINSLSVGSTSGLAVNGGTLAIDAASTVGVLAISNATLTTNAALHVTGSLSLGAGGDGTTLNGTGVVTIDGLFTWFAGVQSGSGRTIANGGINFAGNVDLDGRQLDNGGTATWKAPGAQFLFQNGAVFNNGSVVNHNAVFDARVNAPISHTIGTHPRLTTSAPSRKRSAPTQQASRRFRSTTPARSICRRGQPNSVPAAPAPARGPWRCRPPSPLPMAPTTSTPAPPSAVPAPSTSNSGPST